MITFKIALANNVPAFSHSCVGARVLDPTRFAACVENVIATGDFQFEGGLGWVNMPAAAFPLVSGGTGKRTEDPDDYLLRAQNGRVDVYLKRKRADPVIKLDAIVRGREQHLARMRAEAQQQEVERILVSPATHFLIGVFATTTHSPLYRVSTRGFLDLLIQPDDDIVPARATLREIRQAAWKVHENEQRWAWVAD